MKIKTSELSGAALDWAVRYAVSGKAPLDFVPARDNFSTCWTKGGPIIEREQLWLTGPFREREDWKCGSGLKSDWDYAASEFTGPTPLIAAMRCYVASMLGDDVEVPEGLS